MLSFARASWGVRVPSALCTRRNEADLKERQIPKSKIDPAGAPVMGGIVLRAQDKKDNKWDAIFERPGRGLCECTVVADWEQIKRRLGTESRVLSLLMSSILIQYATASPILGDSVWTLSSVRRSIRKGGSASAAAAASCDATPRMPSGASRCRFFEGGEALAAARARLTMVVKSDVIHVMAWG